MTEFDTGRFAVEFYAAMRAQNKHFTLDASSLNVCGEVGEMVEALRRFIGMARRPGSIEELSAELADVEISAYVFAAVSGDVGALTRAVFVLDASRLYRAVLSPEKQALLVFEAAGKFAEARLFDPVAAPMFRLAYVVDRNRTLARLLGVDLRAAVEAKAAVIMSRGFGAQREVQHLSLGEV